MRRIDRFRRNVPVLQAEEANAGLTLDPASPKYQSAMRELYKDIREDIQLDKLAKDPTLDQATPFTFDDLWKGHYGPQMYRALALSPRRMEKQHPDVIAHVHTCSACQTHLAQMKEGMPHPDNSQLFAWAYSLFDPEDREDKLDRFHLEVDLCEMCQRKQTYFQTAVWAQDVSRRMQLDLQGSPRTLFAKKIEGIVGRCFFSDIIDLSSLKILIESDFTPMTIEILSSDLSAKIGGDTQDLRLILSSPNKVCAGTVHRISINTRHGEEKKSVFLAFAKEKQGNFYIGSTQLGLTTALQREYAEGLTLAVVPLSLTEKWQNPDLAQLGSSIVWARRYDRIAFAAWSDWLKALFKRDREMHKALIAYIS